jgi:uncharacterized protein YbaR (Trm112 family)
MSIFDEERLQGKNDKQFEPKKRPVFTICPDCKGTARRLYYQTKQAKHNSTDVAYCVDENKVVILNREIQVITVKH